MNLTDRLRDVIGGAGRKTGGPEGPPGTAAEVLGGEWHETRGQRYLLVDRTYAPGHRHGRMAVADGFPGSDGWPNLHLLAMPGEGAPRGSRLLFFDLETTGLAGGAGTSAFLVGCGWFDGASFRVRQFFLASYAGEMALLEGVAEIARSAGALVTYNGKTFDLPLIDTRYLFHRLQTPFAGVPHIDMLHPARRLWRGAPDSADGVPACRLSTLERAQLGHCREDDVHGFEIPSRYFHFVRTGDARPLDAVLEHNREDLLALAMVTARAAQLLGEGASAARTAREAIGLGRLYERGGLLADARACFARAADMRAEDAGTRGEALRAFAVLCRRERRYDEAAGAWRRLLDLQPSPPSHLVREAAEALAVHHEHRIRDLSAARRFALQSLELDLTRRRTASLEYRLARLDRKLGPTIGGPSPLF